LKAYNETKHVQPVYNLHPTQKAEKVICKAQECKRKRNGGKKAHVYRPKTLNTTGNGKDEDEDEDEGYRNDRYAVRGGKKEGYVVYE